MTTISITNENGGAAFKFGNWTMPVLAFTAARVIEICAGISDDDAQWVRSIYAALTALGAFDENATDDQIIGVQIFEAGLLRIAELSSK